MKDIRRLLLGCFIRVRRRVCESSERRCISIDIPLAGRGGLADSEAVLERGARLIVELFETLLVIDVACEFLLTYN
jgi:hypothetical protein